MLRSAWRFLAAVSLTAAAARAPAETRPRYGGTLVMEIHDVLTLTDPAEWPVRLVPLVYDRLVRLDASGEPQPGLATSWEHDAANKRWEFRLRPRATFHDGTPVTAAAAAACLKDWSNATRTVAAADTDVLVFQSETPVPDLPVRLAGARYAILMRGANGVTVGAGPFRIAEWQPGKRALLAANEGYWGGRPFVDFIEVQMARAYRDQSIDLELAKADLVEIPIADARRAAQRSLRTWTSAPAELVALVFERGRIAANDARTREAVALSIDRAAIQNVLLDRQGESTGAALPGWLSGYAFLFPAARDIERARQLAVESVKPGTRFSLVYDPADPLARPIVDRIALNAREAGIGIQAVPGVRGDLRLIRYRLRSLDPAEALGEIAAVAGLESQIQILGITPEALFAAERKLLEDFRVMPLFHLPEIYGLSTRVMNWDPQPWGDWRLDNVWLKARKR
jgi:peptide/nickel transport system substrate-binding protein